MQERFTSIDQRFVAVDKRFDKVDAQMKVFGKKLDDTRVDIIGHVDRVYDQVVGRLENCAARAPDRLTRRLRPASGRA